MGSGTIGPIANIPSATGRSQHTNGYTPQHAPRRAVDSTPRVLGSVLSDLEQVELDLMPLEGASPDGSDAALLAMLGDMAQGAGDDGDVLSSGILDFLPMEVQFDDPPVKALIYECASAWESAQKAKSWARKLHKRKTLEIRSVKEHRQ